MRNLIFFLRRQPLAFGGGEFARGVGALLGDGAAFGGIAGEKQGIGQRLSSFASSSLQRGDLGFRRIDAVLERLQFTAAFGRVAAGDLLGRFGLRFGRGGVGALSPDSRKRR